MKKSAIIVAGGKGLRMGSKIPKQFIEIDSKPIIARTIERFLEFDPEIQLVVVIPIDQEETWNDIREYYFAKVEIYVAHGGATRFDSVVNGLDYVDEGLVAIHDAVRPYVSGETIQESFDAAEQSGSGVAAVELKDSIREITDNLSRARDRRNFRLIQTPQTFQVDKIKEAYKKAEGKDFLDDASVYESAGNKVNLISGTYDNIKITTPDDLK